MPGISRASALETASRQLRNPAEKVEAGVLAEVESGSDGSVCLFFICRKVPAILNVETIETDWNPEKGTELPNQFEVGVMPQTDYDWTRGKYTFKSIHNLACDVSVIALPFG
jgi:hypothetical protein